MDFYTYTPFCDGIIYLHTLFCGDISIAIYTFLEEDALLLRLIVVRVVVTHTLCGVG